MTFTKIPEVKLSDGRFMPWQGYGVWQIADGDATANAVAAAIQSGYRSIDTAEVYGNETGVGMGIVRSGANREDLFITTKVHNDSHGYDKAQRALADSLKRLGLDYVDLYLIHWPMRSTFVETWKALVQLQKDGLARSIGVSNFHAHHLDAILDATGVVPVVNQVEIHPYLTQKELIAHCKGLGIQMEAWSPLLHGGANIPTLQQIAQSHGKSAAQVVLRWHYQNGVIAIPKTVTPARMDENKAIFDFSLSPQEMAAIDALNKNERIWADHDPDNFPWDA